MQPHAPFPSPAAPVPTFELDIASAATPSVAKVAGTAVFFTGVVLVLMALQTLVSVRILGIMQVAPYLLLALGVTLAPLGVSIFRASGWAPVPAVVLSTVALLFTTFWLFWSFANGFLALFALMAPVFSIAALVLSVVSVGPCRRVAAARARLVAAGLGFGL
jgi:hypothetical protein